MKTLKLFSLLAAMLVMAAGCREKENFSSLIYEITAESSEDYTVEVQENSRPGEEIPVVLTLREDAELKVLSVKFNGEDCEFVSQEGNVYNYKFTMPESHVKITVETSSTAFTIAWNRDDPTYKVSAPASGEPGMDIDVTITVVDLKYAVESVSYGTSEELCEQQGDPTYTGNNALEGTLEYKFRFTMPEKNVNLNVAVVEAWNRIFRTSHPNATIKMINRFYPDGYNPEIDPDIEHVEDREICKAMFEDEVQLTVYADPGYEFSMPALKGTITGKSYALSVGANDNYPVYYTFVMPAEPVELTIEVWESDEYKDKEFVGTYSAFWLRTNEYEKLYEAAEPTMKYELKANRTYTISSSDENQFTGIGFYRFDEAANTFAYQYDEMKNNETTKGTNAGLGGNYTSEFTYVTVSNMAEDMPDKARTYIAAKDGESGAVISDFVSASGAGNVILYTFKKNGTPYTYLYDKSRKYTMKEAELEFKSGSAINEDGASALVKVAGEPLYKYDLKEGKPSLSPKGSEAGTYTGAQGDLVLDGFGNGTFNGAEGTYVVESLTVTFTDNSLTTTVFTISMGNKTYTISDGDVAWDGPKNFTATTQNNSASAEWTVSLELDYETYNSFTGQTVVHEGEARFIVSDGSGQVISDARPYAYDAASKTITVSQVMLSDAVGSWNLKRQDLVFSISEDKNSFTFQSPALLVSYNSPSKWVNVEGLVLNAVQE